MRRIKGALGFFLLLFFLLASKTLAQSVTALKYGSWSDWQTQPIEPRPDIQVDRQIMPREEEQVTWKYTRFVYYNIAAQGWFAAAREQQGDHCEADSGKWEELVTEEPLQVIGQDGEDAVYEGNWFNRQEISHVTTHQEEKYRSRPVERITCEVTSQQMLMFPGDFRKLTVNFFDQGALTYISSDSHVALVDQEGTIYAQGEGIARITVHSSTGKEVTVEVMVCKKEASIPDGVYSLRLAGSTRTLDVGKRLTSQSNNLMVKQYNGDKTQRFVLAGSGEAAFTLHPRERKKWRVDVVRKSGKVALGSNVQVSKAKDKGAQTWQAIAVPDGSYILYSRAKPQLVLGAEPQGAGNNVRMEALEDLDQADRWIFIKEDGADKASAAFYWPVNGDGAAYVSGEYSQEHQGMAIGSNGKRLPVLSAARGAVVQVDDSCDHDYEKTPDSQGRAADPCGQQGQGLGRYVVVDHGGGILVTYAHLSQVLVEKGETVYQGTMLGRMGATGDAEEVGLYLEMEEEGQKKDPRSHIKLPAGGSPIG